MSKSFIVKRGNDTFTGTGSGITTRTGLHGSNDSINGTENQIETPVRTAGVFSNMAISVTLNTRTGTVSVRLRNSGVNGNSLITINAGATGIMEDTSNTDTFANTDEGSYAITFNNAGGNLTIPVLAIQFEPTSSTDVLTLLGYGVDQAVATASTSIYQIPNGGFSNTATETSAQYRIRDTVTITNFSVGIGTNARTATTFRVRKNTANGNANIVVGASTTGTFEDTSNTDSFVSGDDLAYVTVTGTGVASMAIRRICADYKTSGTYKFPMLNGGALTQNFNVTNYFGVGGGLVTQATEANTQIYPRFSFTVNDLFCRLATNTIATSATTVMFRKGTADTALTLSIAAGATGLFSDTSNSVSVASTDLINYRVITPNTSGAIALRYIGTIGYVAPLVNNFVPQLMII